MFRSSPNLIPSRKLKQSEKNWLLAVAVRAERFTSVLSTITWSVFLGLKEGHRHVGCVGAPCVWLPHEGILTGFNFYAAFGLTQVVHRMILWKWQIKDVSRDFENIKQFWSQNPPEMSHYLKYISLTLTWKYFLCNL